MRRIPLTLNEFQQLPLLASDMLKVNLLIDTLGMRDLHELKRQRPRSLKLAKINGER